MKSKKTRSVMNCLLILIIALMTSQGVIGMGDRIGNDTGDQGVAQNHCGDGCGIWLHPAPERTAHAAVRPAV